MANFETVFEVHNVLILWKIVHFAMMLCSLGSNLRCFFTLLLLGEMGFHILRHFYRLFCCTLLVSNTFKLANVLMHNKEEPLVRSR